MLTVSITASGKVQGVFYRQSTKEVAISLGINGLVRNLPDGSVKIIATGAKAQLDKLVDWCRQGPPKSKVTGIDVQEISLEYFDKFSIEYF